MSGRYDGLMELPCPTSRAHERMPRGARAAQFAPFAALTGFEGVLEETARLTDYTPEPDEAAQAVLNERLTLLAARIKTHPFIRVTRFVPDQKKSGGAYLTASDRVRRIDVAEGTLLLAGGETIKIADITEISGDIFPDEE